MLTTLAVILCIAMAVIMTMSWRAMPILSLVPQTEIQWQELDAGKQPLMIGSSANKADIDYRSHMAIRSLIVNV